MRRKVTPIGALKPHKIPKSDLRSVRSIFETIEGREKRYELNLYITGYDEDEPPAGAPVRAEADGDRDRDRIPAEPTRPEGSTNR
jgi:succinate dehydrogenase / fumarate reductase iron-sulfur subunit